ncbi:MAG: PQQ-binding-like beta-propeller repeat protein, partial [Ktedonobacteraceae bacterium]
MFLPNNLIFIQGKSSQGYLLNAHSLGGVGGQIQAHSACASSAFGGAAVSNQMAFIPCTDGLREIKLGSDGKLSNGWSAPSQVSGSPIVGGNTVYALDPSDGTLYALDAATG